MTIQIKAPGIANFSSGTIEKTVGVNNDYRVQVGDVAVTTAAQNAVGSLVILAQVNHKNIIDSILISNTDMDTNGSPTLAFNLGLYTYDFRSDTFTAAVTTASASLAAVFASASTQLQAAATLTELASSATNVRSVGKMAVRISDLIGDANLAADQGYFIGIAISTASATAAAGTVSFRVSTIG